MSLQWHEDGVRYAEAPANDKSIDFDMILSTRQVLSFAYQVCLGMASV